MPYTTLTDDEVAHFLARGHVAIRGAFPRDAGEAFARDIWTRLGYDPNDTTTWEKARIHMPSHNRVDVRSFAPRVWGAICDLMGGEDRVKQPLHWHDGFIVNLGRPDDPETWRPASPASGGWHKDGDFFRHFLDSPEQALLVIPLWSDIEPTGGGTFLACDSVGPVAKFLAGRPGGVLPNEFDFQALVSQCSDFVEATGQVGDVFLMHPYLLHAASQNALRAPRFITNPPVAFNEPMRFSRKDGDYSPVERAVLNALEVDSLDFLATTPRERVIPERQKREAEVKAQELARLQAANG